MMRLELYIFRNTYLLKKNCRYATAQFFKKPPGRTSLMGGGKSRVSAGHVGQVPSLRKIRMCHKITELACPSYWSLPALSGTLQEEARAPRWSSTRSQRPEKGHKQQGRHQRSQHIKRQSPGPYEAEKTLLIPGSGSISTPWFPQL